jgi:spermidine synthase
MNPDPIFSNFQIKNTLLSCLLPVGFLYASSSLNAQAASSKEPSTSAISSPISSDPIHLSKIKHREKSVYRNILVMEGENHRCLSFGRQSALQSCIQISPAPSPDKKAKPDDLPQRPMALGYTKALLGALLLHPNPKRVLVIGMGGGIVPMALRKIYPEIEIETVELDPAVIRVAQKYFDYKQDAKNKAFSDDGRVFVRRKIRLSQSYDLVVLDAFERNFMPEHMVTKEFLQEISALLSPSGILASNTFKHPVFSLYESATYRAVFPHISQVNAGYNRILLAQKSTPAPAEAVQRNGQILDEKIAQFGIRSRSLIEATSALDDPAGVGVKILTDQYSPSNLLLKRN